MQHFWGAGVAGDALGFERLRFVYNFTRTMLTANANVNRFERFSVVLSAAGHFGEKTLADLFHATTSADSVGLAYSPNFGRHSYSERRRDTVESRWTSLVSQKRVLEERLVMQG